MVAYRKTPNLRDIFVRAKTHNSSSIPKLYQFSLLCTRTNTCKYCSRLSHAKIIKNPMTKFRYPRVGYCTFQTNNIIYGLECNLCHIRYIGQTKKRMNDRIQSHPYDIKSGANTTAGRNYKNHGDINNLPIPIYIL